MIRLNTDHNFENGKLLYSDAFYHSICAGDRLLGGRYVIESILHEDCDGVVCKCLDSLAESSVVIMPIPACLPETETDDMRENFAKIHGLFHDNIAGFRALEQDKAAHTWYLVRDYVDGEDLESLLQHSENGRLPVAQETISLLRQIAWALDYAHDHSIIHGNVRCSNVLLSSNGYVKLINFQMGGQKWKNQPSQLTYPPCFSEKDRAEMHRKWEYKSPEQWKCEIGILDWDALEREAEAADGEDWDALENADDKTCESPEKETLTPATDEYSLAVVAYRCLSGHTPFGGNKELHEIRSMVLNDPMPEIKGLSQKVNAVLAKALSKAPGDRYGACKEFVDELEAAVKAESNWELSPSWE